MSKDDSDFIVTPTRGDKKVFRVSVASIFVAALSLVLLHQYRAGYRDSANLPRNGSVGEGKSASTTSQRRMANISAPPLTTATGAKIDGSKRDDFQAALAAKTGIEAWNHLKYLDVSDFHVSNLLGKIRDACALGEKGFRATQNRPVDSLANSPNMAEANNIKATREFFLSYCGGSDELTNLINAALKPQEEALKLRVLDAVRRGVEYQPVGLAKNVLDRETLMRASKSSVQAADAVINEMLVEKDPDAARTLAGGVLAAASAENGALSALNVYLPHDVTWKERSTVFTIAAELIACQRVQGCGQNSPLALWECGVAGSRRCQPGEDLLAYRRRTTSPMLYQAAEQIAAAMLARRYR
jgi:hypothetical protein